MGADYYKLLGIDKNASDDDIKKAYKKMVGIPMYLHHTPFEHANPFTGLEMAP